MIERLEVAWPPILIQPIIRNRKILRHGDDQDEIGRIPKTPVHYYNAQEIIEGEIITAWGSTRKMKRTRSTNLIVSDRGPIMTIRIMRLFTRVRN